MRRRAGCRHGITRLSATILSIVILISLILGIVRGTRIIGTDHEPSLNSTLLFDDSMFGSFLKAKNSPAPIGIASYGLHNHSYVLQPCTVSTTAVQGEANIASLSAFAIEIYAYNNFSCNQCAALQLNLNLVVQTGHGEQVFWVQNVVSFQDTSKHSLFALADIVFNLTKPDSNISSRVYGAGSVQPLFNIRTVYGFGEPAQISQVKFGFPLHIKLETSVQVLSNQSSVKLSFYDDLLGNKTFDTAYFSISGVHAASFVVSPYELIPYGNKSLDGNYDAELVWAGYCSGETAKFVIMDSSLSLIYLNSKNILVPFPSYYTYGSDSGEKAINLEVLPTQEGARVTIGANNNSLLKN